MSYLPNNLTTQFTGIAVPGLGTAGSDLLRINELDPNFAYLNDGTALLYRIMTMFNKDTPSMQPQYWFFNDDQLLVKTTAAEAISDVVLDFDLADAIAVVGVVIININTDEIMLVTAVSGVNVTVTRAYQGTTAAAITLGDEIALLGSTLEEFGAVKGGITNIPSKVDNYISMFSQSVNSSDLQEVTDMLNGVGQIGGEFNKMTTWLMRQMDYALRHSRGYLDTNFNGTGKTAYYTKGLDQYLTTTANIPASGGTWYDFNAAFNDAFLPTNSSPQKTLVTSQTGFSTLNAVAFDRWTANPAFESAIGAVMGQINLDGGGVVDVVLDKHGFMTNGTQAYLLDMPYVKVKPMAGFELNWRETTLANEHGRTHEIFGSTSMKVQLPDLHRKVTFS